MQKQVSSLEGFPLFLFWWELWNFGFPLTFLKVVVNVEEFYHNAFYA